MMNCPNWTCNRLLEEKDGQLYCGYCKEFFPEITADKEDAMASINEVEDAGSL